MALEYHCQRCGTLLKVSEAEVGTLQTCPHCQLRQIVVPQTSLPQPAAVAAPERVTALEYFCRCMTSRCLDFEGVAGAAEFQGFWQYAEVVAAVPFLVMVWKFAWLVRCGFQDGTFHDTMDNIPWVTVRNFVLILLLLAMPLLSLVVRRLHALGRPAAQAFWLLCPIYGLAHLRRVCAQATAGEISR